MSGTRVVHCRREPYDVYIGRAMPRFGQALFRWLRQLGIERRVVWVRRGEEAGRGRLAESEGA